MTIEQAIKEGYTRYTYNDECYGNLSEPDTIPWEYDIYLIGKETNNPVAPSGETIAEILADMIDSDYKEMVADESDKVYEMILSMKFDDVSERIQKELDKIVYYEATTIKLTKNESN